MASGAEPPPPAGVTVVSGALVGEHLARLRDRDSGPGVFRRATCALASLVVSEALRLVGTAPGSVTTPLAAAATARPARRVTLVPILRAGLALVEPALALLPADTRVGFLGMARDERTLDPTTYLDALPDLAGDEVLVLEVMIATGGSSVAALDTVSAAGADAPRLAGLIAAPEGLARIAAAHPDAQITVAAIDERFDERGFIVPGLGDAGDRLYGQARA